jgi:hypothetical protein
VEEYRKGRSGCRTDTAAEATPISKMRTNCPAYPMEKGEKGGENSAFVGGLLQKASCKHYHS